MVAGVGIAGPVLHKVSLDRMSFGTAAVVAATRDNYKLTSPVALPLFPNILIESGTIAISKSGAMQSLSGAEALALLSAGRAKLLIDDAVLSLAPTQSAEPANTATANAVAPLLEALLKLSFSDLELSGAVIRLGRGEGERPTLSDLALQVTKTGETEAHVFGSFVYRNQKVDFDIVMGTEARLQHQQQRGKAGIGRALEIDVKSELFEFGAAGTLSAGDQPQLSSNDARLSVTDLRNLARWIGFEFGHGEGLGAFSARGPMEFSPRSVAFSDTAFELERA